MTTLQALRLQGYTLTSEELLSRLSKLGIDYLHINTLKKWSKNKLIPPYKVYYQKKVRKRGHPGNPVIARKEGRILQKARLGPQLAWPAETIEEAAAMWAVRERYRRGDGRKKQLSRDQIDIIKRVSPDPRKPPFAVYTIPPVAGPLSSRRLDPRDIKMSFVNDDTNGLDLFPGETPQERAARLNELVIAWTAAREKVRAWASEGMSFTSVLEQHPEWGDLMPSECDLSQVDPWRVWSPPPWCVDRPASVALHWTSRPSSGGVKFGTWIFQMQRELRPPSTDRDEIVLYENGVDTREFFRIDVGDRETWAKAELEKTERELEENERTVRRTGLEDADVATIIAMERSFETLAPREKEGIKAMQKRNGLAWRRAQLKNQFSLE